jgi:hypothetical protein
MHSESSVAVAVRQRQFGKPRRGTSAVGSRYPRTGRTADKEDSLYCSVNCRLCVIAIVLRVYRL